MPQMPGNIYDTNSATTTSPTFYPQQHHQGTFWPQHTHQVTPYPQQHPHTSPSYGVSGSYVLDCPELAELLVLLEVEPGGTGLLLQVDGQTYSLANILAAQMKFMERLSVHLIHIPTPKSDEE